MSIKLGQTMACVAVTLVLGATLADGVVAQPPRGGRGGGRDARDPGDAQLEKAPLAADDFEKQALEVLADVNRTERYLNVPEYDGRLLRDHDSGDECQASRRTGNIYWRFWDLVWLGTAADRWQADDL